MAQAQAIRIPAKLPAIKGKTAKQVEAIYRAERQKGLGHVRVMARLGKMARGQDVTPLAQLRRFQPVAQA